VQFRVRAVVVSKSGLEDRFAVMSGQDLTVELVSRLVLRASEPKLDNDVLVMDGATLTFCRALRIRLSEESYRLGQIRPFKKIVGGRSRNEDGLQLADMIAGAIRHHVMGIVPDYFRFFSDKMADLWCIPGAGQ
jgi:hypothetical protein